MKHNPKLFSDIRFDKNGNEYDNKKRLLTDFSNSITEPLKVVVKNGTRIDGGKKIKIHFIFSRD